MSHEYWNELGRKAWADAWAERSARIQAETDAKMGFRGGTTGMSPNAFRAYNTVYESQARFEERRRSYTHTGSACKAFVGECRPVRDSIFKSIGDFLSRSSARHSAKFGSAINGTLENIGDFLSRLSAHHPTKQETLIHKASTAFKKTARSAGKAFYKSKGQPIHAIFNCFAYGLPTGMLIFGVIEQDYIKNNPDQFYERVALFDKNSVPLHPELQGKPFTAGYYCITGSNVNVRTGPGTQYGVVGSHNINDRVTGHERMRNGWYKIGYPGLYVSGQYVRPAKQEKCNL